MTRTGDEYRKKAAECRQRADEAKSEMGKSEWLRLGEQWHTLALENEYEASREENAGASASDKATNGKG